MSKTEFDETIKLIVAAGSNGPWAAWARPEYRLQCLLEGKTSLGEFEEGIKGWISPEVRKETVAYIEQNLRVMRKLYKKGKLVIPQPLPMLNSYYEVPEIRTPTEPRAPPKECYWKKAVERRIARATQYYNSIRAPGEQPEPIEPKPFQGPTIFDSPYYKLHMQKEHEERMHVLNKPLPLVPLSKSESADTQTLFGCTDFDGRKDSGHWVYTTNKNSAKEEGSPELGRDQQLLIITNTGNFSWHEPTPKNAKDGMEIVGELRNQAPAENAENGAAALETLAANSKNPVAEAKDYDASGKTSDDPIEIPIASGIYLIDEALKDINVEDVAAALKIPAGISKNQGGISEYHVTLASVKNSKDQYEITSFSEVNPWDEAAKAGNVKNQGAKAKDGPATGKKSKVQFAIPNVSGIFLKNEAAKNINSEDRALVVKLTDENSKIEQVEAYARLDIPGKKLKDESNTFKILENILLIPATSSGENLKGIIGTDEPAQDTVFNSKCKIEEAAAEESVEDIAITTESDDQATLAENMEELTVTAETPNRQATNSAKTGAKKKAKGKKKQHKRW